MQKCREISIVLRERESRITGIKEPIKAHSLARARSKRCMHARVYIQEKVGYRGGGKK